MNAMFITALLLGQPQAPPVRSTPPQAPALESESATYASAYASAVKLGKPLVIFVGASNFRGIRGAVCVSVDELNGKSEPRIVMAFPDGDSLKPGWNLDADASDAAILQATAQRRNGVQSLTDPFLRPIKVTPAPADGGPPIVDDDDAPAVRGLAFLKDLEPYTSAKRSQISFRRWSGYIGSVPRESLEAKWRFPGGLADLDGWTSKLYRTPNAKARVYLERQDPSDGNSTVTWGRSYGDVVFAEVLRNSEGKLFEVRTAEKSNGEWTRSVAFKDPVARPEGYTSVKTKQCVECHSQAGRSDYGGAAIPGGDTVISEPIEPVESGQTVQGGYGTSLDAGESYQTFQPAMRRGPRRR